MWTNCPHKLERGGCKNHTALEKGTGEKVYNFHLFLYTLEFSENVVNAIREAKESDPSASSLANLLANHNSGPYKQSKVLQFFPKGFNPNSSVGLLIECSLSAH